MAIIAEDKKARIIRLQLGPWGTNTYIVVCLETKTSAVIDAPAEANTVIRELKGTTPAYILLTHNHLDHIGALNELRHKLKAPLAAHPSDSASLASPPEKSLRGGERIDLGKLEIKVFHTPGHTPGSLCFLTERYLISGDTLFPGGPGKTRSSADFKQIVDSIKEKLLVLPGETLVLPGHGEPTTLEKEKGEITEFLARPRNPNLHGDVLWKSA